MRLTSDHDALDVANKVMWLLADAYESAADGYPDWIHLIGGWDLHVIRLPTPLMFACCMRTIPCLLSESPKRWMRASGSTKASGGERVS